MNKKMLMQYTDLQDEIRKLEKRIDMLNEQTDMVSDVVQNGFKRHLVIYGYDINRSDKLNELKSILKQRYDQLLKQQTEIEKFINDISDSKLRKIFEYRYIENYSWVKVAQLVNSTEDSVRKKHDRFLKKF